MTLDSIFQRKAESDAAKAQAKNDIIFLEKRKGEILAHAEKVANAGDEEEYIRLTDEASQLDRRIYVKNKIADADSPIDPEEVKAAWNEYADQYNKKFRAKYKAYEKERQQLCKLYTEMVNDQYELLQIRKKAGECIGIRYNSLNNELDMLDFDHLPGTKQDAPGSPKPYAMISGKRCTNLPIPFFRDGGDISEEVFSKWFDIFNCVI